MILYNPEEKCPCNSGRQSKECCIQEEPPITNKSTSNISLNVHTKAQLVDPTGQIIGHININPQDFAGTFTFNMRKAEQIDESIMTLLNESSNFQEIMQNPNIDYHHFVRALNDLGDVLHGVRYHQQNFLYRLQLLNTEHAIRPTIVEPGNNVSIVLEDAPLRYELESFITKLITCLDLFAKLAGVLLNKKFTVNKDFWGYLESKKMKGSDLHQIYASRDWIKSLKKIRNEISHDGSWEGYRAFKFEGILFSQPAVYKRSAGFYVIDIWKDLLRMTSELLGKLTKSEGRGGS